MWDIEPLELFYVAALPEGLVTGCVVHTSDGQNHPALQADGRPVVTEIKPGAELRIWMTIGEAYVGLVVGVTMLHSLGPLRFSFANPFTYEGIIALLFTIKDQKKFNLPESPYERTH